MRVPQSQHRLEQLLALTMALAEQMDTAAIARFVLGAGRAAIDANRGTLCLLTDDARWLEVVGHVGYDSAMMHSEPVQR